MARKRRKSSSKSGGSTLFGVLLGLILGLAAAVAVALFVTKVPMPFVDRATRDPAQTLLPPNVRHAPDPNIGLQSAQGDFSVSTPPPEVLEPGTRASPALRSGDHLGDLISSLTKRDSTSSGQAAPSRTSPDAGSSASSSSTIPGVTEPSSPAPAATATPGQAQYFLQAGAFRSERDAETIRAQVLMLGLPVQIQKAQVGGSTINRIRVGPFEGIDEMNRARAQLGTHKIESSVVRQ